MLQGIYRSNEQTNTPTQTKAEAILAPDYVKENAFTLHDGMIAIRTGATLTLVKNLPDETARRVRGLKAIASGNPLVIEKAAVDAEVMRLTRLKKQHAESQYQMRYRMKSLAESITIAERNIANIREDLRTRTSTRGDNFSMTVQKETFTDRTKAGRALVFLAAALKPFQTTKPIGSIGGFPITIQKLESRANLTIHGKHSYDANVSDKALGTIASIEHALNSMEDPLQEREADMKHYRRQREDLGKQLNQSFEHQEKLVAAVKRQQEIVAALDITKNQATASVDDGAEQTATTIEEKPQQSVRAKSAVAASVKV